MNIYHLEAPFIVIIGHLCPFNLSPLLSQRKSYSRVLISICAPWCVGREVKTCTIWDTAKAFMIVILPKRVSLPADQLLRLFFTLSIFSEKNGIVRTHQNALKVMQNVMENLELCDVWRIFYPNNKRFIWRQRQPDIFSTIFHTLFIPNVDIFIAHTWLSSLLLRVMSFTFAWRSSMSIF